MQRGFRNVIFAGGGSRCFWQLGFWEGARAGGLDLGAGLHFAGSVSAGCAMATAAVLGRSRDALELFKNLASRNPGNIHWQNLGPFRHAPVLPHMGIYRRAMLEFLRPEDIETFRQRKISIAFLMSTYPPWLGGALGAALGLSVYSVEKLLRRPMHPLWTARCGYRPLVGFAHECSDVEEFIELVLASSCIPPFLPGGRHRGKPVLDGGLIDNVPVLLAEEQPGETLVLLTRPYDRPLPNGLSRTYTQPSQPVPINKFDYANPSRLQEAWDLGLEDGTRFAEKTTDTIPA